MSSEVVARLLDLAQASGNGALVDLVHDAKIEEFIEISEDSVEAQIRYLVGAGYAEWMIREALESKPEPCPLNSFRFLA